MWETLVTVQRPEGTQLVGSDGRNVTHVPVKVDPSKGTLAEAIAQAMLTKFHTSIRFKIFYPWMPTALIQQKDILLDEQQIDPDTNTYYKYRVIERPKNYPFDHQELEVETVIGTK